ncbi:MAG TPA: tetraacyldisaccharide 4'-kinase [Gammaproteobacteria bacterium]
MSAWLLRRWYSPHPAWFLIPFSWLFWLLSALRRGAYALGILPVARLPVPVIVAGNISVGGTGKTPFVIWLAQELKQRGFRPGIVTRGYGANLSHARLVTADAGAHEAGDETLLLARHGGVPVAAGRDRVAAARLLAEEQGVDAIISDDGLQHYRLPRRYEIVLLDGSRGLGNGWLLPAGPLRERAARLQGVQQVVIKQVPGGSFAWPGALSMRLKADTAVSLQGGERKPLSASAGQSVHAVAGIGNPEQFFATLRAAGLTVDGRALPDHAQPLPADLEFGDKLPVFMTEKDAVKCAGMTLPRHWYLEAAAEFDAAEAVRLLDDITRKLKG